MSEPAAALKLPFPQWMIDADPILAMAVVDPLYLAFLERRLARRGRHAISRLTGGGTVADRSAGNASASQLMGARANREENLRQLLSGPVSVSSLALSLYAEWREEKLRADRIGVGVLTFGLIAIAATTTLVVGMKPIDYLFVADLQLSTLLAGRAIYLAIAQGHPEQSAPALLSSWIARMRGDVRSRFRRLASAGQAKLDIFGRGVGGFFVWLVFFLAVGVVLAMFVDFAIARWLNAPMAAWLCWVVVRMRREAAREATHVEAIGQWRIALGSFARALRREMGDPEDVD